MGTYKDKHSAVVYMLEQARNNHGYNMTDLEELTGITRSQLYRWMNGDAKNIQQKSFQAVAHNLGYVITNAEDGIEVTHHIQTQGEPEMLQQLHDKERIITLQEEKIQDQNKEIDRLNKIIKMHKNYRKQTKPAFHFKTKVNFDTKTNTFGKSEVTGDTSMTGYTTQFLSDLNNDEWFAMFHPESANQLMSSIPAEVPDQTHNKFNNLLWKSKDGTYKVYNMESYYNKKEGVVRAYYYWVNGDIEGKS